MSIINRPTDAELEILQVLWQNGPSTVRQIHEALEARDVGYTTTLKLMQIMFEKGLLNRDADSRSHVYSAKVNEAETKRTLLNRFVETTFRGSASQMDASSRRPPCLYRRT